MKLADLDALIKTVCPIDGINSSGVISFKPEATDAQKTAAQALMDANLPLLGMPDRWSPDPLLKIARAGREIALNRLAGIGFAAKETGDAATVAACLVARQALLDITKLPAVKAATDDASLTAAMSAGYAAIVMAAPANVRSAFADIQS